MLHHAALITTRLLDADAYHACLEQIGRKCAPARQRVGNLPALGSTVNRDVDLSLEVSISAVVMLVCVIFFDPAL